MASNFVPIGVTCHLPVSAFAREQVDAFYHAALDAGGKDNGVPGLRPNYHAHYYAAFVIALAITR